MPTLAALLDLDVPVPTPRPVPRPLLIGDIATARAGVPELLIQMARAENRDDPDPQP
jgi:hypothetical protein